MTSQDLFLSGELEADIRIANPWWRGERVFGFPPMRRWAFGPGLDGLQSGMTPATVLRGPRQVGKTTLLHQVIHSLLDEGVDPQRIFRLQFDELPEVKKLSTPILALSRWYATTILGKSLNQAASDGQQAFIFLDEVQMEECSGWRAFTPDRRLLRRCTWKKSSGR